MILAIPVLNLPERGRYELYLAVRLGPVGQVTLEEVPSPPAASAHVPRGEDSSLRRFSSASAGSLSDAGQAQATNLMTETGSTGAVALDFQG